MTALEVEDIQNICITNCGWEKLRNKTIFISGGTGFIGSIFVDAVQYRNRYFGDGIKVIVCSRHLRESGNDVEYIMHDITSPINIEEHIDFIVHLASNTHPMQYATDPVGTITTNIFGTYHLLNLAKQHSARFLLASSVEIYGEGNGRPMDESFCGYIDCNTARAGYNESKRLSESLCQSYLEQYGVDCVIARLSRIYGADKKSDSKAMSQFISTAIDGKAVILKSKGEQRYSYLYVADAVTGLIKIMTSGSSGEAYNVASQYDGRTLGEYAKIIADYCGVPLEFDLVGQKGSSAASYAITDGSKLCALGWKARYDVTTGLKRTIDIYRERTKS